MQTKKFRLGTKTPFLILIVWCMKERERIDQKEVYYTTFNIFECTI